MHLIKNKTDCICIHPKTVPEKTKTQLFPIIKYIKKEKKSQPREKEIIKINKYSLVYIVKCAFYFSFI